MGDFVEAHFEYSFPHGVNILFSVKVSFGCIHNWSTSSSVQHVQSVCTLCNRCCEKGDNCTWNGIMGTHLRECGCKTQHSGCSDCGICVTCARDMWVSSQKCVSVQLAWSIDSIISDRTTRRSQQVTSMNYKCKVRILDLSHCKICPFFPSLTIFGVFSRWN